MNIKAYTLILLAAASLALGCSKVNSGKEGSQQTGTFTISARQPATRTALDDSNVLTWTATDKIGLVKADGSTNEPFTTKAEDITNDGKNAKFAGNGLAAGDYYAYYPYKSKAPITSTFSISLDGQNQYGISKDHLARYDVMMSDKVTVTENQTEADFTFRHIGALHQLGVHLKTAEAGVKVTGLTFRAHDASNNLVNAFTAGVYFDPASGEVKASSLSPQVTLAVSSSPDLGADPSNPFVMNLIMCNKGATSYPYTIDVLVYTNKGLITLVDVKTIASAADEFQPGKCYTKTLALDVSTATTMEVPDLNFRNYLRTQMGVEFDGTKIDLSKSMNIGRLTGTTQIDCKNQNIVSLQGIEYFANLTSLVCGPNKLTSLDVSKNIKLTNLVCSENQLTALDVSMLPDLTNLTCYKNLLENMDVTNNKNLTALSCFDNQLKTLNVSGCAKLTHFSCSQNQLKTLNVSGCVLLNQLRCDRNQLESLDASASTVLDVLSCYENQLTALDVSKNTALTNLSCEKNKLTELDITPLPLLTSLLAGNQTTGTMTLHLTAAQLVKWDATWKSMTQNASINAVEK